MPEFGYLDFCPSNLSVPSTYTIFNGQETNALNIFIYSVIINFLATFVIKLYQKLRGNETVSEPIAKDVRDIEICAIEAVIYKPQISRSCFPIIATSDKTSGVISPEDLHENSAYENRDDNTQEDVEDYCFGGYMPVKHNDTLANKYVVLRKLGYGHFSTVWLCQNNVDKNYVAVKIVKSATVYMAAAEDEIRILSCTMNENRDHPGHKKILQMLEDFTIRSINGFHKCVVFELMGPSLLHLLTQSDFQGLKLPGVRNIIKQVLEGLVYLHDVCKIIHTDLKPENILIKIREPYIKKMVDTLNKYQELEMLPPKSYMTSLQWHELQEHASDNDIGDDLYGADFEPMAFQRTLSYPKDSAMQELIHHPKRHQRLRGLQGPMWVDPNIEVKIADLGNACWGASQYTQDIQTKQYRALEVIIGADYSFSADIWSVGCLTFELATGEYLFSPRRFRELGSQEDHLGLIWELLDGIPSYVARSGRKSDVYFDNAGNLRHIEPGRLKIWKLEDVLVDKYNWKRVDAIPFATFVQAMIEPDPELRITATAALENQWIHDNSY